MEDLKPVLNQAGVVSGVVVHALLHVDQEPLEPGGLAEGADVLLLHVPLLQRQVETEVEDYSGAGWSPGVHHQVRRVLHFEK